MSSHDINSLIKSAIIVSKERFYPPCLQAKIPFLLGDYTFPSVACECVNNLEKNREVYIIHVSGKTHKIDIQEILK